MEVTINTGTVSLNVTSALITAFVGGDPDPVTLTINNCTTSYNITVDEDPLVILPEDLGTTDYIPDGVYSFTLTKTGDTSITREFFCLWVNRTTTCSLDSYILANPTTNIHAYIQALQFMNTCGSVSCADYCDLYAELKKKLATDECGC